MIFEAVITALIASFYIGFENGTFSLKKTATYYGTATIISTVAIYVYLYLFTPAYIGIMGGFFRVAAIPILFISVCYLFLIVKGESNNPEKGIQIFKIITVLGIFVYLLATPIIYSEKLHDVPKVKVYDNISDGSNFAPIDVQNMRIVDQSMAYYLGNKVMGSSDQNLGSQFEVNQDDFSIQNVNGRLYWVAPLEFRDIFKWISARYSPGFIMVDAEDPSIPAKLYTGYKMEYMNSAYFGDYIIRHLYSNGFSHVHLRDINFEVTDSLQPRWVVSLTTPSVLNDGDIVNGVAIIDPETGDIENYQNNDVPKWVDRVMPEDIARNYLDWYGKYVHGWINSVTSEQDVNVISSDEMWLIHGNNGQAYWFAGMTSPSSKDQSLTSIVLVNSRDGTINLYRLSGWNEQAVINAVGASVSNYKNYHGTAPIPYDCSGRLAYVVPVAASTDNGEVFQEVSIVDAITGHVVLGQTKAIAFEEYRRYLNQNGFDFAITNSTTKGNITGTVNRISGIISANNNWV